MYIQITFVLYQMSSYKTFFSYSILNYDFRGPQPQMDSEDVSQSLI